MKTQRTVPFHKINIHTQFEHEGVLYTKINLRSGMDAFGTIIQLKDSDQVKAK